MAALLALVATTLTSLLPILNKHLLRDARPALVAWVVNAASLPILLAGTHLPNPPVCPRSRKLGGIRPAGARYP
jgi:hypothetical protein